MCPISTFSERICCLPITYSPNGPTDNFLSSILVSNGLILCCGNSILHPKKKIENDKDTNFWMTNNKKMLRKYM